MAMTPSQLSIIVKSQGVEKAAQDLDKLAKAAASVDTETKAFVIAQSKLADSNQKVGKSSEATARGISVQELALIKAHEAALKMNATVDRQVAAQDKLNNAVQMTARGVTQQELAMIRAHEQALKMNVAFDKQAGSLKNASHHGNIFNNTLRSMATAALAYMGVNFAMGIIKEADSWSLMQSKLKLATGSMEGAKVAQKDLFEMSQRLRVPLEDTAKLFTRMSVPLMKMGQTTSDVKKVVESFSMALKLGGATGQEASSAMLQLSQSFNAGRLNGGEFNSVAEAAPSVLRALEVELVRVGKGADLARYGLKELAAKGVLSTEIMAEALKRAAPKWEEDFKQLPLTFDGAMTRIKNAWQKAVGEVGGDTKFNQRLAESLKKIEDVLPAIALAVGNAFLFMVDNAETFITVLKVLAATIALVKLGSLVTLVGSAYTAFTSATTAVAGLTAALKLLHLTPVGLALLAVAAAGTAVYSAFKDYNKETEQTIENNKKIAQNGDLLKAMEAETIEMKKQADAARIKAGLGAIYSEDIKKATKAYTEEEKAVQAVLMAKSSLFATQAKIRATNKSLGMENVDKPSTEPMRKELESAIERVRNTELMVGKIKEDSREKDNFRSREAIVQFGNERNALIENARVAALTKNQIAEEARKKAKDLLDEDIKKYDLESNEAGIIAINNRKLKIERDYREALDKIKTPKSQKDMDDYKARLEDIAKQTAVVNQEMSNMKTFGDEWEKMLPEEKKLMEVIRNYKDVSVAVGEVRAQEELSAAMNLANQALEAKASKDKLADKLKVIDTTVKSAKAAQEELKSIEDQIAAFGKVKGSIEESEIARLNENLTKAKGVVGNEAVVKALQEEIATREKLKAKTGELAGLKDASEIDKGNEKILADMWDTSKIDKFDSASSKALKGVVKGFAEVAKAMDKYKSSQDAIKKRTDANDERFRLGKIKEIEYIKNKDEIQRKADDYQINAYASMADAAKNFFKEGTKGYQALDAVSKVFHAAQMARTAMETMGLAVKGVANQAGGDVYSAIPRMAAMAAIMAGLGYATGMFGSSGSGGMKAADVQKIQGTGTVFGDAEAKSESISKSIDMLKASYDKLYPVNQKMLSSLQSIESSMTGLASLIVKQGGIAEGSNFNIKEGTLSKGNWKTGFAAGAGIGGLYGSVIPVVGSAIGGLLGGIAGAINSLMTKKTQTIIDSGVQFGGSLSEMQKGQGFNQYASVDTTTSKWFGLSKSTSNSVQTQGLSDEISKQLGLVFTNMQTVLEEAGKTLYGSSTGVTTALNNMVMDISKISLKGLSGDDVTKAINNVISKALDQMAVTAFTNLDKFESIIGEGYAQKVIRIASTFATVNATMEKFNFKLFEMNDAGIQASLTFSKMFGTLQEMQQVTGSYFENFYREEDQLKIKTEAVTKIMKGLGQEMPATREGFKALVDNAQKVGNSELVANLMKVSDAFAEVVKWVEKTAEASEKMDYTNTDPMFPDWTTQRDMLKASLEELAQSAQKWLSISKQASDIRASINTLLWGNTATQEAAVKKSEKLWKMMASDITVEQKLSLAGELKDAIISKYQLERDSVTKLIDFSKQLRTYVDGLKLGSLSPLTMTQKLAEARKQYETTLSKAQAGDTAAQGALTGSASAYLEIAKTAYASSDAYQAIFMNITSTLESMTLDTKTADEKLLEVNQRQEAELIKLIYALDTIESVADSYYKTSLQSMTNQLTTLNNIYTRMGVFDGVATELSGLPAEIAAALSGTFGRSSGKDYVEALYGKFAGKTGSQIDQGGMQYWMRELELYGRDYVLKAFQDSVAKTTQGIDVPKSPFAPAPMMPPSQASVLSEQVVTLKEEIVKLREDAQLQTIALMETLTLTSKQNADRIVEGTTEGMDKNNPNWNKATLS